MDLTRMTPHRARRTLRLVNLALAALLIAVGVPLLGADEQAEARIGRDLRERYERGRSSDLRWAPRLPVAQDAMQRIVWRFRAHAPAHWPLSGPLPPAPQERSAVGPAQVRQPAQLEALGHVTMVAHDPATGSAIGFRFAAADKDRGFSPGEIIRASEEAPARFRLKAVRAIGHGRYHVIYDVLAADGGAATETLLVDTNDAPDHEGGCIWPLPEGEDAQFGTTTEPKARVATTGPRVVLRLLRPTTHVNPRNARDRVIEFDAQTRRLARGRGVAVIAELVKTSVAVDPATKRVLGVRITGLAKGLAAEAFDVRRGDILVAINDREVKSLDDAIRIAQTLDPDSEQLVKLEIDRAGRTFTYRVDARDPDVKREMRYFTWKSP